MAEVMKQKQIDALLLSLNHDVKSCVGEGMKYHLLVCIHCRKRTESSRLDMHVLLSATGRCSEEYGHMFVSEGWLVDRKTNNQPCWMRSGKIEPVVRTRNGR